MVFKIKIAHILVVCGNQYKNIIESCSVFLSNRLVKVALLYAYSPITNETPSIYADLFHLKQVGVMEIE